MLLVLISFNQKRFQLCINLSRVLLLMAAGAIATIESDFTEKKRQFSRKSGQFPQTGHGKYRQADRFFREFATKIHGLRRRNVLFIVVSGVWGAKKRPTTAFPPPTALRPEPTCRDLPCGIWGALIADDRPIVISSRPPEPSSPSAVVADLWSGKPFHHQGAMACHLHQCRMLEGQGVSSDSLYHTYGRRHTSGKHRHGSMTWVRRCGMSS